MGDDAMRRAVIAAIIYVIFLIGGVVGYMATSVVMENFEEQMTTPSMDERLLGSHVQDYEDQWDLSRLGHGVAWALYFVILTIVFFMDALSREHEEYYPPGGYYR